MGGGRCVSGVRPPGERQRVCQEYQNAGLTMIRGTGRVSKEIVHIDAGNQINYPTGRGKERVTVDITEETEKLWIEINNAANDHGYRGPETVTFEHGDRTVRVTYDRNRITGIGGLEEKPASPAAVATGYETGSPDAPLASVVNGKK